MRAARGAATACCGPGDAESKIRMTRSLPQSGDAPTAGGAYEPPVTPSGTPGLVAGEFIAQYELIRELGSGGMGTVYLARDTWLGRLVAIKLLSDTSGADDERLMSEARAIARCRHPNIVVIHEVGEHLDIPYMVLEYLDGQTLRAWLERGPSRLAPRSDDGPFGLANEHEPVPVGLAVDIMVPVVRALVCAHERGIVHRDLKPENVVLVDSGEIKVVDFGLAGRFRHSNLLDSVRSIDLPVGVEARPGSIIGTMQYMAPEQWQGGAADPRSDLWTVGVMLHEMVTGRHPLAPLSRAVLLEVADTERPMPSLRERRPELGELAAIIDCCLRKPVDERPASAAELLAQLEALTSGRKRGRTADADEHQRPYAGLAAFQEDDGDLFFGREREVAAVVTSLRNRAVVTIAGPSGTGKSSLVRAGVIPALKRSGASWQVHILRPGRDPLGALTALLDMVCDGGSCDSVRAGWSGVTCGSLREQPGALGACLRAQARRQQQRILLFVDQFEELYTLGCEPAERAAFAACLDGVADDPSSPLRVMVAVRSDFVDRLAEERVVMREFIRALELVAPIGADGLREALTRPAWAVGYRFESADMVEAILAELSATRVPLPLLQFTASMLWARRDRARKLLTRSGYDQLGGVVGALSTHADAVLAGLSADERELARTVLLRLVTAERTRAVVAQSELREICDDAAAVDQIIDHLAGARLIHVGCLSVPGQSDGDPDRGTWVELVHESLIERWDTLRRWLDESAEDSQFLAKLSRAAGQWEASDRADGMLWRGESLAEALRWRARYRGPLSASQEQFLRAGQTL
ncbi:MAG: serine/threonine-protein kinase, partial [Myxococcota bacterium]